MSYAKIILFAACFFLLGCNQDNTDSIVLSKESQIHQCGVGILSFNASVFDEQGALKLFINEFELDNNASKSPFLELQDLMQNSQRLSFESTDSDQKQLFHTWQLFEIETDRSVLGAKDIASDILETQNLHIHLVRLSFHQQNFEHHDDEHETHDHGVHDDEIHEEEEVLDGPSLTLAVYQQLRGQSKPSWCDVTVPIEMTEHGAGFQIQTLKPSRTVKELDPENSHKGGHGHEH